MYDCFETYYLLERHKENTVAYITLREKVKVARSAVISHILVFHLGP